MTGDLAECVDVHEVALKRCFDEAGEPDLSDNAAEHRSKVHRYAQP